MKVGQILSRTLLIFHAELQLFFENHLSIFTNFCSVSFQSGTKSFASHKFRSYLKHKTMKFQVDYATLSLLLRLLLLQLLLPLKMWAHFKTCLSRLIGAKVPSHKDYFKVRPGWGSNPRQLGPFPFFNR
jgi:hypothetical protein